MIHRGAGRRLVALSAIPIIEMFVAGGATAVSAAQFQTTTTEASTTQTTDTTTSTESEVAQPEELRWRVVDKDKDCTNDGGGEQATEMTVDQKVCLSDGGSSGIDNRLLTSDGTGEELTLKEFTWTANELASGADAKIGGTVDDPIMIRIAPAITLTVEWQRIDQSDQEGDNASEQQPSEDTKIDPKNDAIAVPPGGVRKVITIGGFSLRGLSSGFVVRETIPAGLEAQLPDELALDGDGSVDIPIEVGESKSYALTLRDDVFQGNTQVTSKAELWFEGTFLRLFPDQKLQVTSPKLAVAIDAASLVDEDEPTVKVVVENTGAATAAELTVTLTGTGSALRRFSGPNPPGNTRNNVTTWDVSGFDAGQTRTFEVDAELARPDGDSTITWGVDVTSKNDPNLDPPPASEKRDVSVSGVSSSSIPKVDFTASQMIRLIAFVVAFALLTIIFGAWIRTKQSEGRDADEEDRQHELRVFKAFTDSVLVLVIMVIILVLALQGRLEAQSAGSLIGVIAGYVLGQGRS